MSVLSSLTGNVKKALLIIHKPGGTTMSSAEIASKTEAVLLMATAGGTIDLKSATLKAAMFMSGMSDFHIMEVQYNPSSISLSANAQEIPIQYLQQNMDAGCINQAIRPPSVVMSVDLIFDAVVNKDAFMAEKFRLSATDIAADVAYAIQMAKGGYTVKPQTNALVALTMREDTRTVTFKWADMTFTGDVSEVQARYTMFSVSGKPIRSVVRLNLTQTVQGVADQDAWDKRFTACFGDKYSPKDSGANKSTGGNLLNIGL